MRCCDAPAFRLVEELGHVEAVDWDLGTCTSCGAHLLRQWSEHAPTRVFLDPLTGEEAERFRDARGIERRALLRTWYADH